MMNDCRWAIAGPSGAWPRSDMVSQLQAARNLAAEARWTCPLKIQAGLADGSEQVGTDALYYLAAESVADTGHTHGQ